MASHFLIILGISLLVFAMHVNGDPEDYVSFDQNYVPLWGATHLTRVDSNRGVQLLLDQSSGSGFRSKLDYGSGRFGLRMKLPYANTSGIIISFYLTSAPDGPIPPGNHDEIDFEFISSTTLQTNVFADDSGN
ncbi:xyloglucan endotransglucosylase/hydrolase protein 3-like [Apium graveolens]|uniref:xyloglucan endotransglucosylase/hydrolase protein 3-like n=1 Tax=Apium graveolens TaxID=4045 RepID=UPI003D7B680F